MPTRRSEQPATNMCGFTLVELLLAVALTAVIAALAYAGIAGGVRAAAAMQEEVTALTDLQRAFAIMEEDLTQVRQRPLLLGVGYHEAAFTSGNQGGVLLTFTRGGVSNPQLLPRSDLQRVRYVVRDGSLWRQHWPQLDRTAVEQQPQQVLLLAGIDAVQIEYLQAPAAGTPLSLAQLQASGGAWQPVWDSDAPAHALSESLPLAVRITIKSQPYAQVQRVYDLQ